MTAERYHSSSKRYRDDSPSRSTSYHRRHDDLRDHNSKSSHFDHRSKKSISSDHSNSSSKRRRTPSPDPVVKKQKQEENVEEFKQKVEAQLRDLEKSEKEEEELLEKARQRRLAILEKHKQANSTTPTSPQTPTTPQLPTPVLVTPPHELISPISSPTPPVASPPQTPTSASSSSPLCLDIKDGLDMFSSSPLPEHGLNPHGTNLPSTLECLPSEIQTDSQGYIMVRTGEILEERYLVSAVCGHGMFSRVLRVKDLQDNHKELAIKVIRDNDYMKRVGKSEIETLTKVAAADPEDKYCCIRLLRYFKDREMVCLVFEPMLFNLRELIHKYGSDTGISLKAVRVYSRKLLLALHLLKKLELIHADLKPDNILVNEKKTGVKLADFGSVVTFSEAQNLRTPTLVTGWYRAPEIIIGNAPTFAVDIWSTACTIYEMMTGKCLFQGGSNNNELLRMQMELFGEFPKKAIKKGAFKAEYFDDQGNFLARKVDPVTKSEYIQPMKILSPSRDLKAELLSHATETEKKEVAALHDLLIKMFALDPTKRITAEEALVHPFFKV